METMDGVVENSERDGSREKFDHTHGSKPSQHRIGIALSIRLEGAIGNGSPTVIVPRST